MIQIGGAYITFCPREGIHLQKYAIEMGGVSRYFFTCIGVRGRCDSPKQWVTLSSNFAENMSIPEKKSSGGGCLRERGV